MQIQRDKLGRFKKGSSGFIGNHTKATRKKISGASRGRKPTKKQLQALDAGREKHKDQIQNSNYWTKKRRSQYKKNRLGKPNSLQSNYKRSMTMKKKLKNKHFLKKILRRRTMSQLEAKVQKVIDRYSLPYKFVGNGEFFVENINPDFININGEKKMIEVYWKRHKEYFRDKTIDQWKSEREKIVQKYGWEILFLEGTGVTHAHIYNFLKKGGEDL